MLNKIDDETLRDEKRIRVGVMMTDAAPSALSPADPEYWVAVEKQRVADQAARTESYRQLGGQVTNPMAALQRCEQAQRDSRTMFDAAANNRDMTTIDREWSAFRDQLGGRPAPVATQAALDAEYMAYVSELEGGGQTTSDGPKAHWI